MRGTARDVHKDQHSDACQHVTPACGVGHKINEHNSIAGHYVTMLRDAKARRGTGEDCSAQRQVRTTCVEHLQRPGQSYTKPPFHTPLRQRGLPLSGTVVEWPLRRADKGRPVGISCLTMTHRPPSESSALTTSRCSSYLSRTTQATTIAPQLLKIGQVRVCFCG